MYSPFIHLDCSRVGTIGSQQHLSLFIEQPPIHAAAIIDRDVSIPAAEMTECFPLGPKENASTIICSGVFVDIHSDLRPNLSENSLGLFPFPVSWKTLFKPNTNLCPYQQIVAPG
jgi:hypothetical protein